MVAPQQFNSLRGEQIDQIKQAISARSPGDGLTVMSFQGVTSVLVSLEHHPLRVGRVLVTEVQIPKSGESHGILCYRKDGTHFVVGAKPGEINELWDCAISKVRMSNKSDA
jgi:hypothetical protein